MGIEEFPSEALPDEALPDEALPSKALPVAGNAAREGDHEAGAVGANDT